MYLITGLGNPEPKYRNTRHNVGFETIDELARTLQIPVRSLRFRSFVGSGSIGNEKVILQKPMTYMNLSGEAVRRAAAFYHIPNDHIIVISDDVYVELGALRIRPRGSAGGHNGLENIIKELGSDDFMRVRIGVGPQPPHVDLIRFVLSPFTKEEQEIIRPSIERAAAGARTIVETSIETAMNRFNGKSIR